MTSFHDDWKNFKRSLKKPNRDRSEPQFEIVNPSRASIVSGRSSGYRRSIIQFNEQNQSQPKTKPLGKEEKKERRSQISIEEVSLQTPAQQESVSSVGDLVALGGHRPAISNTSTQPSRPSPLGSNPTTSSQDTESSCSSISQERLGLGSSDIAIAVPYHPGTSNVFATTRNLDLPENDSPKCSASNFFLGRPGTTKMSTVLLIVDMQNIFASMTATALPNILKLAGHFRKRDLPVILTQHGHTEAELTPPYSNQLVRKWGPDGSIAIGTKDWELMPDIEQLAELGKLPIVAKNTYDAFLNTNLNELLKECKVERVVVCGVMTDCCCDTTARSAFNRGWETWLVRDACGTASKSQHEAGLRGFGYAFGEILDSKDVLERV